MSVEGYSLPRFRAARVWAFVRLETAMPGKTEKMQRFMGAELARKRAGQKTKTGMSEKMLEEMAKKPKKKKGSR